MKLVIQKVSHASVETEGASIAEIQKGFLVLVGIGKNDTKETIDQYVKKMVNLRIFTDENGKTNLSLKDVNGEILLVSQFTLYANCKKGNRPSFFDAGEPEKAQQLYEYMVEKVKEFMDGLVENIQMSHPEFITEIETQKVISNELEAKMKEATGAYVDQFLKTQGAN